MSAFKRFACTFRYAFPIGLSFALGQMAQAQSYDYANRTIDYVGIAAFLGTYSGFVGFVEGMPVGGAGVPYGCINGVAYFDSSQTLSKYWYTAFTTAKASGLHVTISVTQDASHNCFIAAVRLVN